MGRADNRKSMKMRQKKAARAKNLRLHMKITASKLAAGAEKAPKAAPKKRPAGTTTTRKVVATTAPVTE